MRANVADLERVLLRQVVMRDVSDPRSRRSRCSAERLALPVILAPVGLGGMFARRAEVQAARAAEAAGVPFIESTVSICSIEEVAARDIDAAVVSAVRDARPRLRGGADGARAGGRLAGAGADDRPRGGRRPAPRHPQRGGRRAAAVGEGAPRARPGLASAVDPRRSGQGQAADVRQPREGGAGRAEPGGVSRVGRRPVRPERDVGRHRLGARALERAAGRQGRARPRGRAPRASTPASTASSSRTTAAASSTRCPRPRGRCPAWSTRSATRSRCSPTAASEPASTWSRWCALGAAPC